jgi:gamma-glutamyltranspeptidase/glutathione hydrolase
MTRADLAAFQSNWSEPATTTYRGVGVHAIAENTQGLAHLADPEHAGDLRHQGGGFQTPLSIHLGADAKRLAYEDRCPLVRRPELLPLPIEWLISKQYAAERGQADPPRPHQPERRAGPGAEQGDTTYFSVADRHGMMVSLIQSNFRGMGSGLVADGLGFMFQIAGSSSPSKRVTPTFMRPASARSRPSSPASPLATASRGCPLASWAAACSRRGRRRS